MTAMEAIVKAVKQFEYPYSPHIYTGGEKHWFTYNYAADTGEDFGDDKPSCNRASMQVHFFLPIKEDFQPIKKKIRKALHNEGFSYPNVVMLEENDVMMRHLIFECEYLEEVEL